MYIEIFKGKLLIIKKIFIGFLLGIKYQVEERESIFIASGMFKGRMIERQGCGREVLVVRVRVVIGEEGKKYIIYNFVSQVAGFGFYFENKCELLRNFKEGSNMI